MKIKYANPLKQSTVLEGISVFVPLIALCDKNATENHGNVYGFNLVYSGNFTAGAEKNTYNGTRAYIGINPTNFQFVLEKGESFQTPEAVLVYSAKGLGEMSRIYHKLYRTRLCRGKYRDTERFVLINNWEATYFDFNEDKIVAIAEKAAKAVCFTKSDVNKEAKKYTFHQGAIAPSLWKVPPVTVIGEVNYPYEE